MMIPLERCGAQAARWPQSGRHILAHSDESTIVVHQAYRPLVEIGDMSNVVSEGRQHISEGRVDMLETPSESVYEPVDALATDGRWPATMRRCLAAHAALFTVAAVTLSAGCSSQRHVSDSAGRSELNRISRDLAPSSGGVDAVAGRAGGTDAADEAGASGAAVDSTEGIHPGASPATSKLAIVPQRLAPRQSCIDSELIGIAVHGYPTQTADYIERTVNDAVLEANVQHADPVRKMAGTCPGGTGLGPAYRGETHCDGEAWRAGTSVICSLAERAASKWGEPAYRVAFNFTIDASGARRVDSWDLCRTARAQCEARLRALLRDLGRRESRAIASAVQHIGDSNYTKTRVWLTRAGVHMSLGDALEQPVFTIPASRASQVFKGPWDEPEGASR